MDKCPFCGAETRPGDNFCLNCGNRLPVGTPAAQQTSSTGVGDATIPAEDNWAPPTQKADNNQGIVAPPPSVPEVAAPAAPPAIPNPARVTLRTDTGESLQEYTLEKQETSIGRAPSSDILLSKDKLTSRRHATIFYENEAYFLVDESSANGTFVNGQQIEEKTPYKLQNGDQMGIGEYELVFHANGAENIEGMDTIMVAPGSLPEKYETNEDPQLSSSGNDEFGTRPWNGDVSGIGNKEEIPVAAVMEREQVAAPVAVAETPLPVASAERAPVAPVSVSAPVAAPSSSPSSSATPMDAGVNFGRLTSLPQPQLPDVAPLMAALATLDGQVSSLQEQLNETQEAMRNHESDIAQTTSQLRSGVRRVSERMDGTIADVARSREQLAWAELLQLMEDVMNNPRDIEYVTKLARKARELNKVFQIHQSVLNTLAECTSLLRSLIGE